MTTRTHREHTRNGVFFFWCFEPKIGVQRKGVYCVKKTTYIDTGMGWLYIRKMRCIYKVLLKVDFPHRISEYYSPVYSV